MQLVLQYTIYLGSFVVWCIRRSFRNILYTQVLTKYSIYVGSFVVYYILEQFRSIVCTQVFSYYTIYVGRFNSIVLRNQQITRTSTYSVFVRTYVVLISRKKFQKLFAEEKIFFSSANFLRFLKIKKIPEMSRKKYFLPQQTF